MAGKMPAVQSCRLDGNRAEQDKVGFRLLRRVWEMPTRMAKALQVSFALTMAVAVHWNVSEVDRPMVRTRPGVWWEGGGKSGGRE